MKVLSKALFLSLLLGLSFAACKKTNKGDKAKTSDKVEKPAAPAASAKTYSLDKGTIYWAATKVGGGHNGTINITNGSFSAVGDKLSSGSFDIDINSLQNTDLKAGEGKEKLEGHLKTGDFFEVAKYPKGSFTITSIAPLTGNASANYTVTGNLTLKDKTKSISFPASVGVAGNTILAVAPKFTINRTEWGINYGSGILGTAADKIIHDDVSLNMEITATAK